MKLTALLIAAAVALTGCGRPADLTDGSGRTQHFPTYGLFNEDVAKSDKVCYEISVGNVILSILFVESVVLPVYFVGWSLWNPVSLKGPTGRCGVNAT